MFCSLKQRFKEKKLNIIMKKRKKRAKARVYFIALFFFLFLILFILSGNFRITSFAVFSSLSEPEFNQGIYESTFYDNNIKGIRLSEGLSEGFYTSKIFDAGFDSTWENINWKSKTPKKSYIEEISSEIEPKGFNSKSPKRIQSNKNLEFKKISEIAKNTHLILQFRSCSIADCSDANFSDGHVTSPLDLNLVGRYFQYKFTFLTEDLTISPILYNVTINYNIINIPPETELISPENNSEIDTNSAILKTKVYDNNLDKLTVYLYGDNNLLSTFYNISNSTLLTFDWLDLTNGSHNWTVIANDGKANNSTKHYYFNVNIPEEKKEESTTNSKTKRTTSEEETNTNDINTNSEEPIPEIQEIPKENKEELIPEPPKNTTNQQNNALTGFVTFMQDNLVAVNGAIVIFLALVLIYIFIIRKRVRSTS